MRSDPLIGREVTPGEVLQKLTLEMACRLRPGDEVFLDVKTVENRLGEEELETPSAKYINQRLHRLTDYPRGRPDNPIFNICRAHIPRHELGKDFSWQYFTGYILNHENGNIYPADIAELNRGKIILSAD